MALSLRGGSAASFLGESPWEAYLAALEERPLPTKMATAAVLAAIGDFIAQSMLGGAFALKRVFVLVMVNVLYFAPILHVCYNAFEWLAVDKLRLKSGMWKCTLVMLVCDQLINAPANLFGFFPVFGAAEALADAALGQPLPAAGEFASSIAQKWGSEYLPGLVANWKVWVLPQLINFTFVPPQLRVGFSGLIAIVWNTLLSIMANR